MRILHYILGMPPLRSGGAIRYPMDLAQMQANLGHEVSILYPGEIQKNNRKTRIVRNRNMHNVRVFEIINPLPVPLVTGIRETEPFMEKKEKDVFARFFAQENVEILHLHSLMGLPVELLYAAKESGVKILFTTHDYFGICPKTNLLYQGKICDDTAWEHCGECCRGAEDVSLLIKRQSHVFQMAIRCKLLVKMKHLLAGLRGKMADENPAVSEPSEERSDARKAISYEKLKQYYRKEFELIDVMLYNSTNTKKMYEKWLGKKNGVVISGMHKDIVDSRKLRTYGDVVRFAYLGYPVEYKGYDMLIEVLDELEEKYPGGFRLNTYIGEKSARRKYIQDSGPFTKSEMSKVYADMDLLIVPSLCAETYSLIVLEAISFGVPVVVTENVGACDLLRKYADIGVIVKPEKASVRGVLEGVLTGRISLERMNRCICEASVDFDYESYAARILEIYAQKFDVAGEVC